MDKMISTRALYGDYLAHARTYSHKYIKREPNGHGGWIYTYPTDIGQHSVFRSRTRGYLPDSSVHNTSYEISRSPSGYRDTLLRNKDSQGNINDINFATGTYANKLQTRYRQADKAGQIYQEGQVDNNLVKKDNTKFQQAISSITQTAKSTIDAGKKFLSSIFTNPITERYTIKDTNNNVIASGTRNSNLSEVGKDLVNAGKKWLSNIITTKKTITITDK